MSNMKQVKAQTNNKRFSWPTFASLSNFVSVNLEAQMLL